MRDVNLELASCLYDMAAIAGDSQRAWGYKRAAKAVLRVDRDITPLVTSNTFKSISGIGPTTDRIARELIVEGHCTFVERAVRESGKEQEIARLHNLRRNYLSRAAVKEIVVRKGAPSRAKYRGDFQMHSIYSDGAETLESIVNACLERGWSCAGITDHSYGLSIAGGMSMERAVEQHAEIDALNRKYGGRFRMFKGIEANIRSDGTVDMEPHEMRHFEFIVASPHSALRKSVDQTERMVAAVSQRGVAILGHPQGRVFNMRLGVLGAPGRSVRAGGAGAGAGMHFCARQRRALARRARLRGHRDCPCEARGHSAGEDRQLLAREEVSGLGSRRVG